MDTITTDLYRARSGLEFRADHSDGTLGTLSGHFTRFNEWTEIHSYFEGDFMERVAPGAFSKTIKESRDQVKVLFNHGHDPAHGERILGSLDELREDDEGPWYGVGFYDTPGNRELEPGLRDGAYGASFRFSILVEEWDEEPEGSDHNPKALPERTIREVRLYEFGPVTFPAYPSATAGLRSVTDDYVDRLLLTPAVQQRALDLRTLNTLSAAAAEARPDAGEGREQHPDEPAAGHSDGITFDARSRVLTLKGS